MATISWFCTECGNEVRTPYPEGVPAMSPQAATEQLQLVYEAGGTEQFCGRGGCGAKMYPEQVSARRYLRAVAASG